jgi:hypothetical protein
MANKVYLAPESVITFADSAQTPTVTITLANLGPGTGRVSAQYDRGIGAKPFLYKWRFSCQLTGTNVVGAVIDLFFATGDGANIDGEVGTIDAALPTDKRRNLQPLGSLTVDQVVTNTTMSSSGLIMLADRYISLGVWNGTGLTFNNSTSVHKLSLIPVPPEIQ